MKIVAIYDAGKNSTIDRYTVITDDRDVMVGTAAYLATDDYGGTSFSQWGQCKEHGLYDLKDNGRRRVFKQHTHLGRRVRFEDLKAEVQKHIAERILL